MKVGILSLQGSFFDHQKSLKLISLDSLLVKNPSDLDKVDGIILPGGESTAISKISSYNNLYKKLDTKIKQGLPTLSTCAGTIILAKSVIDGDTHIPNIDIEIQRNAYGPSRIHGYPLDRTISDYILGRAVRAITHGK